MTSRGIRVARGLMVPGILVVVSTLCMTCKKPTTSSFNETHGGTADEWGASVRQTTDGGYVVTGSTASYGVSDLDVWLIKTDTMGVKVWDTTFGWAFDDGGHSVQQTSDGGYIVAGYTTSQGAGGKDFWLIKTDANGTRLWDRILGGTADDEAYSVEQTSDGGYILTGYTGSYGAGGNDVWLVKTDSAGNKVWDTTFGGTGDDEARSVQQTSDGGFIIAGWTNSFSPDSEDAWLVKTDASGNKVWDKTFGGTCNDWGRSVEQTSDGGFIIAGLTAPYDSSITGVLLIKADADGNENWDKTFGRPYPYSAQGYSVKQTSDGGYVIAGATDYLPGSGDGWLLKTDADGNKVWDRTFGGTNADWFNSVQQTSDGGYVLAGFTKSYGAGGSDLWLIKTDADGN